MTRLFCDSKYDTSAVSEPQLLYAGKSADLMTHAQAIECAKRLHRALLENVEWTAKAERKMRKIEEYLTPHQRKQLDLWLEYHLNDVQKGDGTNHWQDWWLWQPPKQTEEI